MMSSPILLLVTVSNLHYGVITQNLIKVIPAIRNANNLFFTSLPLFADMLLNINSGPTSTSVHLPHVLSGALMSHNAASAPLQFEAH